MSEVHLGRLIERIGPVNNKIRASEGYAKVSLMWDLGQILNEEGVEKIHNLAWEVQDKSYITRDLLSYCFRIRRHWETKEKLKAELGGLRSFSAFRHAMPLLDNPKFKLPNEKRRELVGWIVELPPQQAIDRIMKVKETAIGIKNDRKRRLPEVEQDRDAFQAGYDALRALVIEGGAAVEQLRATTGSQGLLAASQVCIGITNPTYKAPRDLDGVAWPTNLTQFGTSLAKMAKAGELVKNRLQRVFPNERLIELADMLGALRTDAGVQQVRSRLKVRFRMP